jgi:hypothetical protein
MTLHSSAADSRQTTLFARVPPKIRGRVISLGEEYWRSHCVDDRLPARADIDPLVIPLLLPQIILLDVERDPWNFRFRLIGTNIVHHLSKDWTGTWMSEIGHMAPPSTIFSACVQVASSGEPLRSDTPYTGPNQNYVCAEDIILPLAADGETPNMLLVFVEHHSR